MTQELGRISKPSSAQYEGRRKLLLVPLVYGPPADAPDGVTALQKYWDEMQLQVRALESALGGMHHVYHESLLEGGEEGLKQLEQVDQRSHAFVRRKCEAGALLEATEDVEILLETLDLQRCLMMPLASGSVAQKLQEWFAEANRNRYDHIAKQIDSTLGENQVGLLLVSERHQIQFPQDIEVFYVSPPALNEFRRWLQNWSAQQQKAQAEPSLYDRSPSDRSPADGPDGEAPADDAPSDDALAGDPPADDALAGDRPEEGK